MSLFGNMGGGGGNSLFGGGGGGGGLFGQRNTSGGGLFGSNNNMGGGGGGNSLFGGGGGGMNNNSSGNLFGNAMGNNNTSGGGLFGNRGGGGGSGLFGSNNNAGGLGSFGGGGGMMGNNNTSGGIGGGLFGNKTGGGGGGLFGGNTGGGMMGGGMMGGGLGQSTIGTFTLNYDVTNLSKSKDQLPIASITALQGYKEKSLDELRIEDYVCHKQKKIPDQILSALQAQWTKNKQGNGLGAIMGVSSGGGMFGGNTGGGILGGGGGANMFGGGGGGGLFGGGSSNTGGGLFGSSGGGGGGLFGNKTGGGGGMFGGNSNTGGGGLFGGNSNTGGGGLFGGNSNTGGGGLFGGGNNAGGGMFGGNSNTGGGGLFGGNSNTGGGGGLFGNKSGGGGLFGGNSNTGGGGGLFGGNSNTGGGGGLFGGNSNTGGGGGLFGNKTGGGGLFGGNSNTGGGGGLFGGNSNTGGGGGLFGGNKTGGLFSGSTTTGGGGLFSGGGNTGGGLFSGNQGGGGGGLFSGGGGSGLFSGQKTGGLFSGSTQSGGLFSGGNNNNMNADARAMAEAQQLLAMSGVDSQQVHLYELMTSVFGPAQSNYNLFGKTLGSKDKQKEMFEKYETGTESLLTSVMKKNVKSSYNPFDKPSRREYSGIDSDLNTKIFLMNKTMGSKKKEEPTTLLGRKPEIDYLDRDTIIEDGYTDYGKKIKLSSYIEDKSTEKKTIDPKKVYDTIRLFVLFNQDDDERKFSVEIKSTCTCLDLKKEILKIIFDSPYLNLAKYKLLYKNKILSDHSTVKEVGFKDNDKLFLISDTEATDDSADKFSASAFPKDQLVPEHLLPKLTKNYSTEPPLRRISRMTEEELRNVENFSIWNDDVKVTFLGKTDILGLDIDEIVMLNHRSIEVYPDNGKIPLPEAGRGLNKPATIEFYNWSVPKKYQNDLDAYRKKLESWADSQNAELVLYDPKRSIVSIKVQNFNLKD